MRSFIASALIIAAILIGQQWVTRASEARSAFSAELSAHPAAAQAMDAWMRGAR
jgi:hypothetical protein